MRAVGFRATLYATLAVIASIAGLASATEPEKEAENPAPAKASTKLHGRLPAYYGQVVNEPQREQIYQIQAEYREKIQALEEQLDALKKERNEKIASILTEEQKKQLDGIIAEAKATRAARWKERRSFQSE